MTVLYVTYFYTHVKMQFLSKNANNLFFIMNTL